MNKKDERDNLVWVIGAAQVYEVPQPKKKSGQLDLKGRGEKKKRNKR